MMDKYDYSKLRGKIVEIFGNSDEFSKVLDVNPVTLSKKLNNHSYWRQDEIRRCMYLLKIPRNDIADYFFTEKV